MDGKGNRSSLLAARVDSSLQSLAGSRVNHCMNSGLSHESATAGLVWLGGDSVL